MQHREGEGGADDDAQYHQQCVQYPGRRLCRPALVTADIFAEEDVECRHDAEDMMGIQHEELLDEVTIGGVATYMERADKANVNLFI